MYLTEHDILCKSTKQIVISNLNDTQAMFPRSSIALMSTVLCTHYPVSEALARLVLGNLAAWTHGACIVYPSEIFNPKAIVDAVAQEKCTGLHGVPTHFLGVLAEVERRQANGETIDTSQLR
jgi:acyl-CoA synthetase (AMP-forming)/AMP-acid ligase II